MTLVKQENECPCCPATLMKTAETMIEQYWTCTNVMCGYVDRRAK